VSAAASERGRIMSVMTVEGEIMRLSRMS